MPPPNSPKTPRFLLLLLLPHSPSLSLSTCTAPPLSPSLPPTQISPKFLPTSFQFFKSFTISSLPFKFFIFFPQLTQPPNILFLSTALTSIVEVEGCRERNFTSSYHSKPLHPLHSPDLLSIRIMGKKRAGETSKAPSQPKRSSRPTSSSATPTSAKGTKDAYPLILPASTRGLQFVSDEQKSWYATLATRNTSEQKFFHADSLRSLGLLDDMLVLIGRLGWTEYITMQCTSYDRLMIEFLSSLHVDWDGTFDGHEVAIYFRMFKWTTGFTCECSMSY